MKQIFVKNNVPTTQFVCLKLFDPKAVSHLKYPIIVKPVDSYSSRGVNYDGGEYVRIGTEMYSKSSTFKLTGNGFGTVDAYYFDATGYASTDAGQYVPEASQTWTNGAMWTNYKDNTAADYIFRGTTYDVTIRPTSTSSVELARAGAAVTATLTYTTYVDNPDYSLDDLTPTLTVTKTETATIGNYRDVLLRITYNAADDMIISVAGLGYSAGISTDYEQLCHQTYFPKWEDSQRPQ